MGEPATIDITLTVILVMVIGMLLLVFAIIVFFIIYQKRLIRQKAESEKAQQKIFLESSLHAQEAERKRIAGDLHDSVGGLLSASRLYVKELGNVGDTTRFNEVQNEAIDLIDNTLVNIREITRNLIPLSLDQFGLIGAVEDYCKMLQQLKAVSIQFLYNEDRRFKAQDELNIYRIIQELLNNTLKYAEASEVKIHFDFEGAHLKILYQDNGIGFDITAAKEKLPDRNGGLGISNIEGRASLLNAKVEWKVEQGKGMQFLMNIPTI